MPVITKDKIDQKISLKDQSDEAFNTFMDQVMSDPEPALHTVAERCFPQCVPVERCGAVRCDSCIVIRGSEGRATDEQPAPTIIHSYEI